jgi:hypothetical protein
MIQVHGERQVLVVSGGDVIKARSTRLGCNFFNKDLLVAVAGLFRSWWSLDIFVWFAHVRLVTNTSRGFYFFGFSRVGHRLLLRFWMVTIWAPEGRLKVRGVLVEGTCYTHVGSSGSFSSACFRRFSVVCI